MSNEQPLVSVILPTFNRANMISSSIDSVIGQTYQNWELIIVDDASTDNTVSTVESYLNKGYNIHYYRLETNSGACIARNKGIKKAEGKFITFLDSDDAYLPQKIELQVKLFNSSDLQNLGVVSCGREDYRDGKKYFEWIPNKRGDIFKNLLSKERVGAGTPFLMVRKDAIDKYKIEFDPEMPAGQDWDFLIRLCRHVSFDYVPFPLVRVNHHTSERVYTNERALLALEKQYEKNRHYLLEDSAVHDKFILKIAILNFLYDRKDTALHILDNRVINKGFIIMLWHTYFKVFNDYKSLLGRVFLKVLNKAS